MSCSIWKLCLNYHSFEVIEWDCYWKVCSVFLLCRYSIESVLCIEWHVEMFKFFHWRSSNSIRYVHSHLRWSKIKHVRVSSFLKEDVNDIWLWSFLFCLLVYLFKLFYSCVSDTNITEWVDDLSFLVYTRCMFRRLILSCGKRNTLALFCAKQFEIHKAFIKNNCGLIIV